MHYKEGEAGSAWEGGRVSVRCFQNWAPLYAKAAMESVGVVRPSEVCDLSCRCGGCEPSS